MVWELVFMLVLLKIPLVYLCLVVWWAIRAEPREEHPVTPTPVPDTPVEPGSWQRSVRTAPGGRRGPHPRVGPRRPGVTAREARS